MSEIGTGLEIYVLGGDKSVTNSEQRRQLYGACIAYVKQAKYITQLGLSAIRRNELYLEDGYNSFEDFARGKLDMAPSTAYFNAKIGDMYVDMIKEEKEKEGGDPEALLSILSRLSSREADAIARLPEEDRKKISETIRLYDGEGNEMDFDELRQKIVVESNELIKQQKSAIRRLESAVTTKDQEIADFRAKEPIEVQDMRTNYRTAKEELAVLKGMKQARDLRMRQLAEARKQIQDGFDTLMIFNPRNVKHFEELELEHAESYSIAGEFLEKFETMRRTYARIKLEAEGA